MMLRELVEMILTSSGSRVAAKTANGRFRIGPELRMHLVAIVANLTGDFD